MNAVIKSPHVSNLVRPSITGHFPAPGGHGPPQECLRLGANKPGIIVVAKVQVRCVMLVDEDNISACQVASLYETVPAHHIGMCFLQETIGGKNVVRIAPCTY